MKMRVAILGLAAALATCRAAAQEPGSLNPMSGLDKAALRAFVELPLFDPARRLPPPEPPAPVVAAAPAAPPPEPPPSLQLVGIVHGHRDLAIVHQNGSEKTKILRNGEMLGDWRVAVHPLGVTLRNGERRVDFVIFAKTGVAVPPPPAPVAVGQIMRRAPDE